MRVVISNIEWDTDGENPEELGLPTDCIEVGVEDGVEEDELDDWISDYLSDIYGYCHNGFSYDIIEWD